ncbi:MAG: Cro/CI family transcriptional regulator [Gemmatimonadaceae bacterium]
MDPQTLIDHFGGVTATARALGVKPPSVSEWSAAGKVPLGRQFQAQVLTKGKLRADTPPSEPIESASA